MYHNAVCVGLCLNVYLLSKCSAEKSEKMEKVNIHGNISDNCTENVNEDFLNIVAFNRRICDLNFIAHCRLNRNSKAVTIITDGF